MASLVKLINRLIPFTTPGTPLLQDILHLALLCAALYFGPQIQQSLQGASSATESYGQTPQAVHVDGDEDQRPVSQNGREVPAVPEMDREDLRADTNPPAGVINDDRPNVAEERVAQAQPHVIQDTAHQRNVGAKKAKSLARKDQRRAYHEFMRAQGDSQRAKDAEGAEAREEAVAAEKERRRIAAIQLEAQKTAEREARRKKEEAVREENARRIDFILQTVQQELDAHQKCDLFRLARATGDDVDEEWVEQVLRASGMIGTRNDTMTMITETGWVARVTMTDMMNVYHSATMDNAGDDEGRITDDRLSNLLVASISQRTGLTAG